jgi:hypothetical protein
MGVPQSDSVLKEFLAHLAIGALRREIASISRVISFVLALAFLMVYNSAR